MELPELEDRLVPFARAKYEDPFARVSDVYKMPGHAGFSYGFTAQSQGKSESWFLRLPPPNVKWQGTADVLRQVAALNALDGGPVPHCSVKWSGGEGAELEFFGRPYFVVPKLEGDVLILGPGGWAEPFPPEKRREMAAEAMTALVPEASIGTLWGSGKSATASRVTKLTQVPKEICDRACSR